MHNLRLIPGNNGFLNVSIPCLFEFSSMLLNNKEEEKEEEVSIDTDFYSLLQIKTNIYGVNFNFHKGLFFTGQRVRCIENYYDLVLGIDKVPFPYVQGTLEYPEEEILSDAIEIQEIDREIKYKYLNQGFYNYEEAINVGNTLLLNNGLRSCGNYDFYGDYKNCKDGETISFVISVPNNRELNPCIIQTFHSKNEEEKEKEIIKFISNVGLLNQEYFNHYLHEFEIKKSSLYLFGFLNLSAVIGIYYANTGIYLPGFRDHK